MSHINLQIRTVAMPANTNTTPSRFRRVGMLIMFPFRIPHVWFQCFISYRHQSERKDHMSHGIVILWSTKIGLKISCVRS